MRRPQRPDPTCDSAHLRLPTSAKRLTPVKIRFSGHRAWRVLALLSTELSSSPCWPLPRCRQRYAVREAQPKHPSGRPVKIIEPYAPGGIMSGLAEVMKIPEVVARFGHAGLETRTAGPVELGRRVATNRQMWHQQIVEANASPAAVIRRKEKS